MLAEIGIILLLFEVGLETDIRQLAKSGLSVLLVAVSGFIWPFLLGFGVSRVLFDRTLLEALFVMVGLSLNLTCTSSTGHRPSSGRFP